MSDEAAKHAVKNALGDFAKKSFSDASVSLLESLGYRSEKRLELKPNTAKTFLAQFANGRTLNPDNALLDDWQSVDFLFQLTGDEIQASSQGNFVFEGKGKYNNTRIESYLFFAIALKNSEYTRTQLSGITREINKLFRMPAMLLFRHGDTLTLSIIPRRLHKRDESKDVLEKVTLIKDIRIADPHRAHIEILFDLSLAELHEQHHFTNWSELQAAWQKTLDSSELNKRFFQEIANWYFWASDHVKFPKPKDIKDADAYQAQSLIRLITRLIFCWFVKEKGLLPDDLFNLVKLQALLKEGNKLTTAKHTVYYKAILQNLFFATLNREMNTPDEPDNRKFRGRTKQKNGRDQHHMIHNVYRYEDAFQDSKKALQVFSDIPFLNGGLFECLDKTVGPKEKPEYVRIDGFSDRDDNPLAVPDFLFFGDEREVDLSAAYGETRFKRAKVRGLIHTFYQYKFTITENTPIEEEIALDPELAGKVFENLLAAYNPETATTARKQTGSFFTPREIVNYMVDEALIAYLQTKLQSAIPNPQSAFEPRLRHLLAYNDEPHQFSATEVKVLIEAIDKLKVLDPACGSGAFPMGMLHKLVFILGKLDPRNEQWEKRQINRVNNTIKTAEKTEDAATRERMLKDLEQQIANIEEAFKRNELDYGRKLYLIENCIYGVDIQPIAVQIAKMRFFISLVVDQRIDCKADNLGIRPLPNLETKVVAANTLIGVQKPEGWLPNLDVVKKEVDLAQVRRDHFSARTPKTKAKYRERDEQLRREIADLLERDGFLWETGEKMANWNPYDQNASAEFFDPEWMFGVRDGFDITIGNPPYVRADEQSEWNQRQRRQILASKEYETLWEKWDLFVPFIERAYKLLKPHGVSTLIVSDAFCHSKYAQKPQNWFLKHARILRLDFCSDIQIFDAAVHNLIYFFQKDDGTHNRPERCVHKAEFGSVTLLPTNKQTNLTYRAFFPEDTAAPTFTSPTLSLDRICYVTIGILGVKRRLPKGIFMKPTGYLKAQAH
ncbi:MAG: Eco57I restriction-modification methylase domain-containing protein [Candidatus Binatia bacterium]|nr:Eco57I restriction-modification methylase domain-containing protein [Candidatus Binatia bacterium]